MSGLHTNNHIIARREFVLLLNWIYSKLNVGKIKYFSDDATETRRPFGQPLCLVAEEPVNVTAPPRKGARKKK